MRLKYLVWLIVSLSLFSGFVFVAANSTNLEQRYTSLLNRVADYVRDEIELHIKYYDRQQVFDKESIEMTELKVKEWLNQVNKVTKKYEIEIPVETVEAVAQAQKLWQMFVQLTRGSESIKDPYIFERMLLEMEMRLRGNYETFSD